MTIRERRIIQGAGHPGGGQSVEEDDSGKLDIPESRTIRRERQSGRGWTLRQEVNSIEEDDFGEVIAGRLLRDAALLPNCDEFSTGADL
jgi:hypothetical protein